MSLIHPDHKDSRLDAELWIGAQLAYQSGHSGRTGSREHKIDHGESGNPFGALSCDSDAVLAAALS
jgi:hypothetical protein